MDHKHALTPERQAVVNHVFDGVVSHYDPTVVCDLIARSWGYCVDPAEADKVYCSLALDQVPISRPTQEDRHDPKPVALPRSLSRLLTDQAPAPASDEDRIININRDPELHKHQSLIGPYLTPLHLAHHEWERRHLNHYRSRAKLLSHRTQV